MCPESVPCGPAGKGIRRHNRHIVLYSPFVSRLWPDSFYDPRSLSLALLNRRRRKLERRTMMWALCEFGICPWSIALSRQALRHGGGEGTQWVLSGYSELLSAYSTEHSEVKLESALGFLG